MSVILKILFWMPEHDMESFFLSVWKQTGASLRQRAPLADEASLRTNRRQEEKSICIAQQDCALALFVCLFVF